MSYRMHIFLQFHSNPIILKLIPSKYLIRQIPKNSPTNTSQKPLTPISPKLYIKNTFSYNNIIVTKHKKKAQKKYPFSIISSMQKIIKSCINISPYKLKYHYMFTKVPLGPPDPIVSININFNGDNNEKKVNLGVGAYRDDNSKPYVFNVVRKVQKEIVNSMMENKEYLPIDGLPGFNKGAQKLLFGDDSEAVKSNRIVTVQALSGTGSLRIGFQFINQQMPGKVLIPNPTWPNHQNIVKRAGLKFQQYPYFDSQTNRFKGKQCVDYLNKATEGSIVLFHACAHNPTGIDPSQGEWKVLAEVVKSRKLIPYFDSAYQGFASGDIIRDAWPIRYFVQQGIQMFVSQSFAKNMGLYGERVGALHVVTGDQKYTGNVLSQLKQIIRANYSSPPIHGAKIAEKILQNKQNIEQWQSQLKQVANRIISMRTALRSCLQQLQTPRTWNHITDAVGMFSYTGLSQKQCTDILINKYHIHLVKNGRISMAGVNTKNVRYIAEGIKQAVEYQ